MVVRADTNGYFEAWLEADPLAPRFPIQSGEGYIVNVPGGSQPLLEGISNPPDITVHAGTNIVSLPLEASPPITARQLAQDLSAQMVVRHNPGAGRFEAFLPDVHTGPGKNTHSSFRWNIEVDTSF